MTRVDLTIGGMSCEHCVASVARGVRAVPGVKQADVAIGSASVVFDETVAKVPAILEAVRAAGYTIGGFKKSAAPESVE